MRVAALRQIHSDVVHVVVRVTDSGNEPADGTESPGTRNRKAMP